MKYGIMILILTLSWGFGQCDANGDGELDVLDVVIEVDCILIDCWEPVCEGVKDIDGNCYETIQIGEQLWMSENLKVTHYNDGSYISSGHTNEEWSELETGAYAVYDDDPSNADIYGNLYNWYAVDDERGICPEGWHVPSDDEYQILTDYLGGVYNTEGYGVAGGKMKEAGLDHWNSPNTDATNESGFTGLPAGYRNFSYQYSNSGLFLNMGNYGYFWSSSEQTNYPNFSLWQKLYYDNSNVSLQSSHQRFGISIRCVGD